MPETRTDNPAAERTLLARHADVLVTMDNARREIRDGGLFVRGNRIEQVGATADLPSSADEVIDLSGHVLLPGVDGSASNDGSQMLAEARQALLLARLSGDPAALTARDALEMATRGGASVLGRDDIGYLAPGMAADFVAFPVNDLRHAGALHDPVAALVFCGAGDVGTAVIDGRIVAREGQLTTLDLGPHLETHNRMAGRLLM